jgi:isopenicillin-N N-acyltransferase-like protein
LHKIVEISGTPRERGYRYGEECKDIIHKLINAHYAFYKREIGVSKEALIKEAGKLTGFVEDYSPEIIEEMRGVAEGAEIRLEEILVISGFVELYYPKIFAGCTTLAVSSKVTLDKETYVAQNNDEALDPWLNGDCVVLLKIKRETGPDVLTYAYAGTPGMMGINSAGIGLCINALLCEISTIGVPLLTVTREVLHQKTLEDVYRAIERAKRGNSLNFGIADSKGRICDIECTPHSIDCLFKDDPYFVHTNHFLSKKLGVQKDVIKESGIGFGRDSVFRYERMYKLISEKEGHVDLKTIMGFFRDHKNYPDSICRHVNPKDGAAEKAKTFDSMIFVTSKKTAWISRGNPCENAYICYSLEG